MSSFQKKEEKFSFSGVYFSWIIIALLVVSSLITVTFTTEEVKTQNWYKFLSFSASGITLIVSTVILCAYTKKPLKETCFIQRADKRFYLYAVLLAVSAIFGLGGINGLFVEFLTDKFGYVPSAVVLPDFSVGNYILAVLTLCVLPAFAEEFAFRGVVLKDVKSGNVYVNALIGGLFFSLFHMNPAQTPYQFIMGFFFSLIAIKSKSSLPCVLAHFINNFYIVTAEYFFPNLLNDATVYLILTVVGLIVLAVLTYLLIMEKTEKEEKGDLKTFFISSLVGILICLLVWVSSFMGA